MISFESDYVEGADERIMRRLLETNMEQTSGYGLDDYSESAKSRIRTAFGCPEADVFFLVGGTQTNSTVIDSLLDGYEGVIAADSGHINVHEAGAVEFSGHKVLALSSVEGKLDPSALDQYLNAFFEDASRIHMVFPGMVYISFPTELGTLYSKSELEAIHGICRKHGMPLFIDGARLGYGLMSPANDIKATELANLCDVFYVGGTKVGALFGEAVVFPHHNAPAHFFTTVKRHGALLAKGRLLGIQFDTLFTDNLYFDISSHAIEMAQLMASIFQEKGYEFHIRSKTNQQFMIMDNRLIDALLKKVKFEVWGPVDDSRSVVRFVTSWATKRENVLALETLLEASPR